MYTLLYDVHDLPLSFLCMNLLDKELAYDSMTQF